METNLDVMRAMFRSLSAGEKIYKFSELRDLLAKENVDVSGFNLRRKADQQALLSAAEKCIYDAERENRIQADIQKFVHASAYEDVINNESDYPDLPLAYGWQFEGVDNSEDCFLYPTTPLTCDVLSGQCCDLSMVTKNVYDDSGKVAGTVVFRDPIIGQNVPQSNKFPIQSTRSESIVPNLLIDDWLLPENYLEYSTGKDGGYYTDLSMVINLVVASVFNRKQSNISRCEAMKLLQQLCPFLGDIRRLENLSEVFRQDNEFYSVLCKCMVSEVRKQVLINPSELPDLIKECTEVRSVIDAKTIKNPSIKLINGWLHPLSEVKNSMPGAGGKPYCNGWQFASMIVGAATGRCPDADSHSAIRMLVDFEVINSENSVALQQAKSDDAIYLQLISGMKEAFEVDIEKQLNQLD